MMAWFSASESAIQQLLTWNFLGICVSGPFYGPLSDAFGRRKPLIIALGVFLFGSIMTSLAQNLDQMLWGRILQGLGSGGCFTLGTAIIFDTFQKEKAVIALTNLNMIVPLIMAAAPMLGGYLNYTFGFRSNFLVIALFVLISLIICLFLFDETLPKEKRTPFQVKAILRDFKQAFSTLSFWQLTIATSLPFAGYIAFLSTASVLFVVEFGVSKVIFPFIQAALLGGWVAGGLSLKRSTAKWGALQIKKTGVILSLIGGLILAATTILAPRDPYLLTSGMVFYAFGANWIIGLYFPEGMEILPKIKGITASLLTSVRLLVGATAVEVTSSLYNGSIYPLCILVIGTMAVAFPILFFYERKKKSQPEVLE
jgi:DHA1 family bicyclomycin/chloramphenicol resistance-like MFS transporter